MKTPMNSQERRATFSLASIFSLRMLGVFMVLPLLSLYAQQLPDTTPLLLGMAVGIYGLTQALFQIPWGIASDCYDRKNVIGMGLCLFMVGSIVAAIVPSIWGVIIGRALQGIGAVGSATIALLADLTRPLQRTKAMAGVGMAIGGAFSAAMVLGPFLNRWLTVPQLFWVAVFCSMACLVFLFRWVPYQPQNNLKVPINSQKIHKALWLVMQESVLWRLNFGILVLHAVLTANFVALPIILQNQLLLSAHDQWKIYLPVLLLAGFSMYPLMMWIEKKHQTKLGLVVAISLLSVSQLLLWEWHHSFFSIAANLWLFFTAFTLLEGLLPSLISKLAPVSQRGMAMGIYSSAQFLGIFVGGLLGGGLYGHQQLANVFGACLGLVLLWLFVTINLRREHLTVGSVDNSTMLGINR